jgi:hypothetical protein
MLFRLGIVAIAMSITIASPALGAENGKVIVALGAGPGSSAMEYSLKLRSADGHAFRSVTYVQDHPLANKRDFDGADENGIVKIISLPAGAWEIFGAAMDDWPVHYRPLASFQIPFTVAAGQTVYIGDYRATFITDKDGKRNFFFEVTDQSARDIPIARRASGSISAVSVGVPDVSGAHTPVFMSATDLTRVSPTGGALAPALCAGDACNAPSSDTETFKIETIPSGAQVSASNGFVCPSTPCAFKAPRQAPFDLSISLAGYQSASARVGVGDFGGDTGASRHGALFGAIGMMAEAATGADKELTPNPLLVVLQPSASPAH